MYVYQPYSLIQSYILLLNQFLKYLWLNYILGKHFIRSLNFCQLQLLIINFKIVLGFSITICYFIFQFFLYIIKWLKMNYHNCWSVNGKSQTEWRSKKRQHKEKKYIGQKKKKIKQKKETRNYLVFCTEVAKIYKKNFVYFNCQTWKFIRIFFTYYYYMVTYS